MKEQNKRMKREKSCDIEATATRQQQLLKKTKKGDPSSTSGGPLVVLSFPAAGGSPRRTLRYGSVALDTKQEKSY